MRDSARNTNFIPLNSDPARGRPSLLVSGKGEKGQLNAKFTSSSHIANSKRPEEFEFEALNNLLLDHAPNPIMVVNGDGSIKYVNPSFENLTGYSRGELLGTKPPYPWWPEEKRFQYLKPGIYRGEKPADIFERYHRNKNGKIFWTTGNIEAIESNDKVKYNIVKWVDITRRKELEEDIREQNARLMSILESSRAAIYLVDRNSRLITFNNVYAILVKSLCGVDVEVGKSLLDYNISPTLRKRVRKNLDRALQGTAYSIETWVGDRAMPRRFAELIYSPVKDMEDKVIGVAVFINDIAERKRVENALRESTTFNAALLENAPVPIILANFDSSIRYVNPAFENLTGFSSSELIGEKSPYPWWPEEKVREYSDANHRTRKKKLTLMERYYRKKNGELFHVAITVKNIRNGENTSYYLGSWVDTTEQKRYEEELRHSREQISHFTSYLQERIEAERKQLSSEIHDELGQMLTALKIDISWLLKRLPQGSEQLASKGKAIMELIDDTDNVVKRISANLRPVILDGLGLPAELHLMVEQFQARTGIRCKLVVRDDLSLYNKAEINIFRIIQEALTNVARHARASKVQISLGVQFEKCKLVVRDDGIGVTEEAINNHSYGLIGMVERAKELGGNLDIEGIPGRGTTIRLNVPLKGE